MNIICCQIHLLGQYKLYVTSNLSVRYSIDAIFIRASRSKRISAADLYLDVILHAGVRSCILNLNFRLAPLSTYELPSLSVRVTCSVISTKGLSSDFGISTLTSSTHFSTKVTLVLMPPSSSYVWALSVDRYHLSSSTRYFAHFPLL